MRNNEAIRNELLELNSPLADFQPVNVFTVPEGYFGHFPGNMLLLATRNSAANFSAPPAGYFDQFAGQVLQRIRQEEEQGEDSILHSISKKNVFKVPAGYFEGLSNDIRSKLGNAPAKVISLKPRFSVFRYAAAACVAVLIGLGIFNGLNGNNELLTDTGNSVVLTEVPGMVEKTKFDQEIGSLTDEAIVKFLEENGEDVDAALVASLADESSLPAAEDYFINDKTLENLLTELNIRGNTNN